MQISLSALTKIIGTLIVVLVFTTVFGFVQVLPPPVAQAGFPVADILGTAASWAIWAMQKVGQAALMAAQWVAQRAWDVLKITWEWTRKNWIAVLVATAGKIAANYLLKAVESLRKKMSIDNYLYYADFLVRAVYAQDYIRTNYPDDEDEQTRLIMHYMISEGQELYNRLNPGSNTYMALQAKMSTNPNCQTGNISPQAPDYYIRMLERKGPECTPAYVVAAYRDATLTALSSAQRAAEQEIRAGDGFRGQRHCGTVATTDVTTLQTTPQALFDPNTGFTEAPIKEVVDRQVDWIPTGQSVICSILTYPASHTAYLLNSMVDQIVHLSVDIPDDTATSQALRSHISSTLALTIPRLIGGLFSGKDGDDLGEPDYALIPPGINANRMLGDAAGRPGGLQGRDEYALRTYWGDMCNVRLPLMFGLVGGGYPATFKIIHPTDLQEGRIEFKLHNSNGNPHLIPFPFFGKNTIGLNPLGGASTIGTGLTYQEIEAFLASLDSDPNRAVEQIIATPQHFSVGLRSGRRVFYDYLWQIYDPTGAIDTDNLWMPSSAKEYAGHYAKTLVLGRAYFASMASLGSWPKADQIKQSSEWVPIDWPYFVDSTGKGYQFGSSQVIEKKIITIIYENGSSNGGGGGGGIGDGNGDGNGNGDGLVPIDDDIRVLSVRALDVEDPKPEEPNGNLDNGNGGGDFDDDGEFIPPPTGSPPQSEITYVYTIDDIYADWFIGMGKVYVAEAGQTSLVLEGARLYEIDGDIVAMWPDAFTNDRSMWKLDKSVSATVKDGSVVIAPEGFRMGVDESHDFIEFEDNRTEEYRVLAAERLQLQAPCGQEPYGPPANIPDLSAKVKATQAISPPLWEWILRADFLKQGGLMTGAFTD